MSATSKTVLVTGAAGFIGFNLIKSLLSDGYQVIGIDNINDYYDPSLKYARLAQLGLLASDLTLIKSGKANMAKTANIVFYKLDICDLEGLKTVFAEWSVDKICHLAAQAGVRYSITNPFAYQKANSEGFLNIIECARHNKVKNFVYASSSSVYGGNTKFPFSESDPVDNPVSLYAATKKANELVAHTYSHLYGLPTIGLRFFTVYGPWGRPDMALFLFTKAIMADQPIDVYNYGKMIRNFTYIDDIIQGVRASLDHKCKYEIFNIGNDRAEELLDFIKEIEKNVGKKAKMNMLPIQPGDVPKTIADLTHIREKLGYEPTTNIDVGIKNFVDWYKSYYQ